MNVIGKSRFLTSVSEESSSKRSIEHSLHHAACILPLFIKLLKKWLVCFTSLTLSYSGMQFTQKFLGYMKFCLCPEKRNRSKTKIWSFKNQKGKQCSEVFHLLTKNSSVTIFLFINKLSVWFKSYQAKKQLKNFNDFHGFISWQAKNQSQL